MKVETSDAIAVAYRNPNLRSRWEPSEREILGSATSYLLTPRLIFEWRWSSEACLAYLLKMTIKGVIPFKYADTNPVSVDIGDFKVTLTRETDVAHAGDPSILSFQISFKPKNERVTVLWKCVATGTVAAVHGENKASYYMLHRSFDSKLYGRSFAHSKYKSQFSKALQLVGQPKVEGARGEIHVEIIDSFIADLSDPKNPLILGPGDAVNFSSGVDLEEGHERQLAHPCCALRRGSSQNSFGLDKVLDSFLHFCNLVFRRYEDFLRRASDEEVSLDKKFLACDSFKLNTLFVETIIGNTPTSARMIDMIAKGVVPFKLVNGISDPIEISDFEWSRRFGALRDDLLCCEPKKKNPVILWTCLAVGTLSVWNTTFGNNCSSFHVHHDKEKQSTALNEIGKPASKDVSGEVYVGVIGYLFVDLKDPRNVLIQGSVDAARVKIDGQELWLSKTVLGAYSPFFAALFKNNKGIYNLKDLEDVKLEEFLQFLGIVHGLNMPIDKYSVERLLTLAELFQCNVVLRCCEDFLRSVPSYIITSAKKLLLCDRFKLHGLLFDTFAEMSSDELKKLPLPSGQSFSPLLKSLTLQKFSLVECSQIEFLLQMLGMMNF
ncbi:hypothetical protein L596_013192 [Steinernema carpocapsae]|uniref:BTB domain-containing protein n=1 Tax=Steinernema carpocapsae TaxID=34508 RepID=A0A4U5P026_STECR|nr:hypothetical protein L596_013192 [Steinernema carpocapsae]